MTAAIKRVPARKLGRRTKLATPGRDALLDAAYRTFARRGYEGTSLRDVASQSDVDVALVARLFGSKAKLWEAVVERLGTFIEPHLLAIAAIQIQQPSVEGKQTDKEIATTRLKALIRQIGRIGRQVPEFPAFVMPEMAALGPRLAHLQERIIFRAWHASEPILIHAINTGVVRVNQPILLFFTLLQSASMPMLTPHLFWGEDAKVMDLDQIESLLVDFMISMVVDQNDATTSIKSRCDFEESCPAADPLED